MTSQLEKLFLHYVMENPAHMDRVKDLFYENKEVRFIYDVVKTEYEKSASNIVPNAHEIVQLVRMKDPTGTKVSDGVLKAVLTPDKNYRHEFVKEKFDKWVLERDLRNGIDMSIDILREIKSGDGDSLNDAADKIRDLINKVTAQSYDDVDMGIDFDNPEAHNQETYANKIATGYAYLDNLMGGGLDVKTLNVLCAESNAGKCCHYDSYIYIRNKKTKQVSKIKIGDLYNESKYI